MNIFLSARMRAWVCNFISFVSTMCLRNPTKAASQLATKVARAFWSGLDAFKTAGLCGPSVFVQVPFPNSAKY